VGSYIYRNIYRNKKKIQKGSYTMQKKIFTSLALGLIGLTCVALNAQATTVTYQDNINFFPGWGNGTNDDNKDQIGTPGVESMTITYDENNSNLLQTVSLSITGRRVFDTLFINTDSSNDNWDYMVRDNDGGDRSLANLYTTWDSYLTQAGIYSVADNYEYTIVPLDETGVRQGHPNGIQEDDLTYTGINSDFITYDSVNNLLTYDFDSLALDIFLGDRFSFAYAPWCANDVMSVPEPGSLLIFGAGFMGLIGIAGRRRKN
jgi:hypothetical protein